MGLIKKFVEFILYPLWDLGYKIGYAVRNFKQVGEFSKKDHVIKTSMIDARIISGSSYIYKKIKHVLYAFVLMLINLGHTNLVTQKWLLLRLLSGILQ